MNDQKDQSDKSEPKLCPFRLSALAMVPDIEFSDKAESSGWAFCIEDKCAMWRYLDQDVYSEPGYCGLAGKP